MLYWNWGLVLEFLYILDTSIYLLNSARPRYERFKKNSAFSSSKRRKEQQIQ